ncbi:MAG: tol-pal system protein YbgF [Desulfobacteraceae bacterium]
MKPIVFLSFFLGVVLVISGCVTPEEFASLENRVVSLEMANKRHFEKAKTLERKLDNTLDRFEKSLDVKGTSLSEKYADLSSDVDDIEQEMRLLSGKIEESRHKLASYSKSAFQEEKQKLARIDSAVSKNYQRLIRLEEYMGFEPARQESSGKKKEKEKEKEKALDSEPELYKHAKSLLDQGKTEQAREEFERFLSLFPDSEKADNARFWMAESYYRDKWYEKAILEYQTVIETYPQGNKLPAALLKQGYAFEKLGETANSRLILKELIKKFPDTREAKIAQKKID